MTAAVSTNPNGGPDYDSLRHLELAGEEDGAVVRTAQPAGSGGVKDHQAVASTSKS